jgi:PHD/YefM family antitoxin component YafN of YafNO toxin-antitoxin module
MHGKELPETIEILSDPEMMKNIREGLEDVKAGRVKVPKISI